VKQVGDCHAEGGEVGEEWHFVNFVGGSVIETDRLGTFIYVENMHTMKKSIAMCGKVGRFNLGLGARRSGAWRKTRKVWLSDT
jgi:hypothetical protein